MKKKLCRLLKLLHYNKCIHSHTLIISLMYNTVKRYLTFICISVTYAENP